MRRSASLDGELPFEPPIEGAHWFGEGLLPELERSGVWTDPAPLTAFGSSVPFGAGAAASWFQAVPTVLHQPSALTTGVQP